MSTKLMNNTFLENKINLNELKQGLIDELDEIVYISDIDNYELLYLNKIGRKSCHVGDHDFQGRKCYEVLQKRQTPCPFCSNSKLTSDDFFVWEYTNSALQKKFIVKDKLVNWKQKQVRMEIAVDITNTISLENIKATLEKTILECLKTLSDRISLDDAIKDTLEIIANFFQGERSYIIEIDKENLIGKNTYEYCKDETPSQKDSLQDLPFDTIPLFFSTFEKKENLIISQIEELKSAYPVEYHFFKIRNIKNLIAVPFEGKHTFTGYIGVDNPKINLDCISMLDSVALSISNEIKRRRLYEKTEYDNTHDRLSNLLNRNSYLAYMKDIVKKHVECRGVILADINGLKQINQRYGQKEGDHQIQLISQIFRNHFSSREIFRLSGDEFTIICDNMEYPTFIKAIKELEKECKQRLYHGVALGYAWDDKNTNVYKLIKNAEEIQLINKQLYYQQTNKDTKHFSSTRLQEFKKAISDHCFKVVLQPKVNAKNGTIHSAEALVRYHHPELGIISPVHFIPVFEKEKTIRYLDFYILDQVCAILDKWKEQGKSLLPISVNFSRVTLLEEDFLEVLTNIKDKYSFSSKYICIEVTETIGVMERTTINAISSIITKAGFKISLDDFGSDYASLSMLPAMDFDELKLDKSLIDNLTQDRPNQIILKCIIDMCKSLGIETVAEGVETYEQFKMLQDFGCDLIQGFYFSRPVSIIDFENLTTFKLS